MELTVSIRDQGKIAAFLNLIKDMDYIEIINVKEDFYNIVKEHEELLDKRIKKIENGDTVFKNWELIRGKYEEKSL